MHVLFLVGGIFHDFDVAPATTAENIRKRLEPQLAMDFLITKDLNMLTTGENPRVRSPDVRRVPADPTFPEQEQGFWKRFAMVSRSWPSTARYFRTRPGLSSGRCWVGTFPVMLSGA